MPQTTQEEVEITALIKGILNGYPGNSAILREYLQNSDDAKASKQIFTLDEQTYPSDSIMDPALKEAQGPALIAYNDGVLRPSDWTALRTIHSSSKQGDEDQTGKNGLGFRASYHLTENPHVLSLNTLMVLDPHRAFKKHPGGMSIDIVDEGPVYKDQLAPFNSIIEGDIVPFVGTAFRLPFRTDFQATRSRINDKPTHVAEFQEILHNFVKNELESVILFLKHITSIEVRRIDPLGKESVLGEVEIDSLDATPHSGPVHRKITLSTEGGTPNTRTWFFYHHHLEKQEAAKIMSSRLEYDVEERLVLEKLSPGVDIAFPLEGPSVKGGLFTLLPLPINIPGSSFHVNATFALTPDRQNLKKKQEVGNLRSRERLLVEWNTIILEEWTPTAWAKALSGLERTNLLPRGWSAWPPEERDPDSYWFRLAHEVTNQVVRSGAPIFPNYDLQHLVSVHNESVLFAHPTEDKHSLYSILSLFGVYVVQPPLQIFSALETIVNNFQASALSPRSLHKLLLYSLAKISGLSFDAEATHKVMEYLALTSSPPTLELLSDLPWFSRTDGSFVSLTRSSVNTRWIMPTSEEEAQLFGDDPSRCMLSWDCVSDALRAHLLKPQTAEILNVTALNVELVSAFLVSRFSPLDRSSDELPQADVNHEVDWLLRFWTWVAQWRAREQFFETQTGKIQHLHLLPTSHRTLRKMSSRIVTFQNVPRVAAKAWSVLGVHGLHDSIPRDAVSILKEKSFALEQGAPGFVSLLIKSCNTDLQPLLEQNSFAHIRNSLASGVQLEEQSLSPQDERKLLGLHVFMVRHQPGKRSILGSASGKRIFMKLPDNFPLPCLETDNIVYIDMGDSVTERLIKLVDRHHLEIFNPLDILKLAIDHWDLQPMELQDRFVEKFFDNRSHISELRERLKSLKFVTVNGVNKRVLPHALIHPNSPLAALYKGEVGKVPTGRFASRDYLLLMQSEGFVDSSLNEAILQERLEYLSSAASDGKQLAHKATALVNLLDRVWHPSYAPHISRRRSMEWFPSEDSNLFLVAPDHCRDNFRGPHAHPYYYDFSLSVLNGVVVSQPGFRSALGWSNPVPSPTLVEQLRHTLERKVDRKADRLAKLLDYLGLLYSDGALKSEVVQDLKRSVDGKVWVPVVARSIGSHNLVPSKHALLLESALGPPFRQVTARLKNLHLPFLLAMGCTRRPSLETLVEELRKGDIDCVGLILEEIARHNPNFDRSLVVVPDINGRMCSIDSVYYRDMNVIDLPGETSQKSPIHDKIPRSLAEALGIPFASSLTLGEDEDEDEQMSEDLVGRIRGFLREYDPQYAMNEFLANADDAGATEFTILLDSRDSHPKKKPQLIAPAFEFIQGSPSLVLYNNETLSDEDFKGLLHVGRGGKVEHSDTHGRHGLGALSFYYFTDVVTVISRDTVLILDPSSKYLPTRRHGQKRTGLIRKFSDIARSYPDQFKSYPDLGFSLSSSHFNGALFILPLVSSIAERSSDASSTVDFMHRSYRDLSHNAFFFTKLEKISASRLSSSAIEPEYLWRLSATRFPIVSPQNDLSQCVLNVEGVKEDWLVATSNKTLIPTLHNATAVGLKLPPRSVMKVQLAIRASLGDIKEPESYLFSTLRLPKTTGLPFHLHSRFAISSNRQSIVFDVADSRTTRESKTSFNVWILEQLVPPLYISALEHLLQSSSDSSARRFDNKYWWLSDPADEISSVVSAAFRKLLPEANNSLFKSADDRWISFRDSTFSGDETSRIRNILRLLNAAGFVSSYRHSGLSDISSARTVDTNFVKQILLDRTNVGVIQNLYNEGKILAADIRGILEYIANDAPLVGLPLLTLPTDKLVTIPGANVSTVYVSSDPSHAGIFPSSLFVAQGYSKETIGHLQSDSSVRVVALSEKTITILISSELCKFITDDERNSWLAVLWDLYSSLPTPPNLEFLAKDHLKIVKTSAKNVSLPECLKNRVIYDAVTVKKADLSSIMNKLEIPVLQLNNSVIRQYLSKRFLDKLVVNFLLCLQAKFTTSFDMLSKIEHDRLTNWLRQNIHQNLSDWRKKDPGIQKSFLLQLPLWEIDRNQRTQCLSASGAMILPKDFPAEHLVYYIKPTQSIASHSHQLVGLLEYCQNSKQGKFRCMSAKDIMEAVSLPAKLKTPADFTQLKPFLRSIFQLTLAELKEANLKVPVSDGTLRNVDELYDHTVSLFEKTLKYTQRPSFLHERFRDLPLHMLRSLGMTHKVDITSFKFCASEVQRLSDQLQPVDDSSSPNGEELIEMSDAAFRAYQEELPRQLMTNRALWASVNHISFIRPKNIRREGVSYDWQRYFDTPLPNVLPPSLFIRPDFEPISWTQRFLCFHEPADELLAVNNTFGVPRVSEVVEHLKVLTTRIAQDHPGNGTLLSDLQATYKWLDSHSEDAREHLLSAGNLKMFLNVNDPANDRWTGQWETAQNIVLNLRYDHKHLRTARDFLLKYEKLLLAAGASTMNIFNRENREPAPTLSESDNQGMRKVQNQMRKSGEFTDMIFVPTSSSSEAPMGADDEYDGVPGIREGEHESNDGADGAVESDDDILGDVVVDPLDLRAHRLVLAAAIPYFRDRGKGWKVEGTVDGIRFYGSAFGAKLLLDYVYTGNFDFSSISTITMPEVTRLLRDLLELMQIADEWNMPKLKQKLEWNIIHKFDMIQRLPHANEMMLEEAEKYNATKLKEALVEFGKHNGMVLKVLQKDEQS